MKKKRNLISYDLLFWKDFFEKGECGGLYKESINELRKDSIHELKTDKIKDFKNKLKKKGENEEKRGNAQEKKKRSIEIKRGQVLQLKNVNINDNVLNGKIQFDSNGCPVFGERFSLVSKNRTYVGTFIKRELTGKGEIQSKRFLYKGCIYKGNKEGKGKHIFDNKIQYNGIWKNNKRDGYGIVKFMDEKKVLYRGLWKNDKRYFYGVQFFENKCVYRGFWKNNKKCGMGTMLWFRTDNKQDTELNEPNELNKYHLKVLENVYVGEWKKDEKNGYGMYIWYNKKNKVSKRIIFQKENCDIYYGYWKKGKKHGYGVFCYNNGNKFIGYWKKNKKTYYGLLFKVNGPIFLRHYKNNRLISEKEISNLKNENIYREKNSTIVATTGSTETTGNTSTTGSTNTTGNTSTTGSTNTTSTITPIPIINNNKNVYTSSLSIAINFQFFKSMYNLTDKDVSYFYKIIYQNFDALIKIYSSYKKRIQKRKRKRKTRGTVGFVVRIGNEVENEVGNEVKGETEIEIDTRTDNIAQKKMETKNENKKCHSNYVDVGKETPFKLHHLQNLFKDLYLIDIKLPVHLLNNLVVNYSEHNAEREIHKWLQQNCKLKVLLNEKKLIEYYFEHNEYLNVFSKCKRKNRESNEKNVVRNNFQITDEEQSNIVMDQVDYKKNIKQTFDLLKHILFNTNLMHSKDSFSFFQYHWIHCCHKKENTIIFKKIYTSLKKHKKIKKTFFILCFI